MSAMPHMSGHVHQCQYELSVDVPVSGLGEIVWRPAAFAMLCCLQRHGHRMVPRLWFSKAILLCSAVKVSTVADDRWHWLSRGCCRTHEGRPRLGRHQALRHPLPVHRAGSFLRGNLGHDVPWLQPHCRGRAAQLQGDQASELLGCAPDLSSHGSCNMAPAPGLAIVTDTPCLARPWRSTFLRCHGGKIAQNRRRIAGLPITCQPGL